MRTAADVEAGKWRWFVPWLVFLIPFLVYAVSLNGVWASDHPVSFLDLDYAIYAHHSFVLGKVGHFAGNSVDIFTYKGYYYSASAPGTAVLAYPFVALGFWVNGGFSVFGIVMQLSELFVALTNALATYVLFRTGRDFFCSARSAAFVAFAYAFSTISWPFATYMFQSDVAALFVLLGVYFALDATRRRDGARGFSDVKAALSGVAIGIALTVDYVEGILIVPVLAYLILANRGSIRSKVGGGMMFVVTSIAGVILVLLYNYVCFGNALTSSEQLYLNGSHLFSGFSYPILGGLYLNLFTPLRGIFVYSPVFALGVAGFALKLRRSSFDSRALFVLVVALAIVVPYSMWYGPTAGNSYGPRYLVPAMPLLLLMAGPLLDRFRGRGVQAVSYALYLVGVAINGLAGFVTAIPATQVWTESPFLTDVLPDLSRGALSAWWIGYLGPMWPVIVMPAIALVSVLPLFLLGGAGQSADAKRA